MAKVRAVIEADSGTLLVDFPQGIYALYGLGKLYLDPRFAGCSAPRAVDYLFAAAQKGHDYGQYALGRLFLAGEVVPKNPAYALIWLEKAVKQENPAAEYLLGKALLLGEDAAAGSGAGRSAAEQGDRKRT